MPESTTSMSVFLPTCKFNQLFFAAPFAFCSFPFEENTKTQQRDSRFLRFHRKTFFLAYGRGEISAVRRAFRPVGTHDRNASLQGPTGISFRGVGLYRKRRTIEYSTR